MTKRTGNAPATQAGNRTGGGGALAEALTPLIAGMTATRTHLLEWVHTLGVGALHAVFRAEAEALAGPKGNLQRERTHHHWGHAATELTFGGRRIQVARPRVRSRAGEEAVLPAVAAWRARDPLTARVLEQILLGVSTRGYAGSLEAGPAGVPSRGTSKSAVSRTLGRRLTTTLAAQLEQRLDELEVLALFLDGVMIAGQTVIVVLGLTRAGDKRPLGLRLRSTENAVVCTELLQDLLARGLPITERVLCVIDGGKGLRKAVQEVLGTAAVIQRCQIHKARNLQALLPKPRQAHVRATLRRAYRAPSADAARRQLKALGHWLESNGHVDAAASLREGPRGNADGADPRTADAAATLLRDDQLHREPHRDGAPRHAQRHALARWPDDSPLGGPGPRARGDTLSPDQGPWRAHHANDSVAEDDALRGRGVSHNAVSDLVAFSAKGKEGSGAILRKGVTMSVSPQTAAASTIDVSQARGL
jgi:transposase-like protein